MDVRNKNKPVECAVNPTLGREREYILKPAGRKKKALVIGGGPAGMEAALILARRGHEVKLYEKGPKLGGLVPLAAMVKDLQMRDLLALVRYFKVQMKKAAVAVHTNKVVDSSVIKESKPDVLIIGAGPSYNSLEIPGSNRRDVRTSAGFHKQLKFYLKFFSPPMLERLTRMWMPVGKRVVVIGGAIHGCQLAEFLIKRKRGVTLVHTDEVLADGIPIEDQMRLFPWFDRKGVPRLTGVKYEKITDEGLIITTREGEKKTLKADTYIIAIPMLPNKEVVNKLSGALEEAHAIGSCVNPGLIVDAIAEGARIAYAI
jgi:2,4-dienoyl-CoA reductase (NADPH2)